MNSITIDLSRLPAPIQPPVVLGSIWQSHGSGDYYMVCRVDGTPDRYAAVNLNSGSRWSNPVVEIGMCVHELKHICNRADITLFPTG